MTFSFFITSHFLSHTRVRQIRTISSLGREEYDAEERQLLEETTKIALDLSALLTLAHLDLLTVFADRFEEIYVPQSVLDEIEHALSIDELKPVATTWKEGDQYYIEEITSEAMEKWRGFLKKCLSFIRNNAIIAPVEMALEMGVEKYEELKKTVGIGALDSVLLALGKKCPLYSDDLGLRMLAKGEWGVSGFWTQSLLKNLVERRNISDEDYKKAIRKLFLGSYHFLSVNAKDIMWIIDQNEFRFTDEV